MLDFILVPTSLKTSTNQETPVLNSSSVALFQVESVVEALDDSTGDVCVFNRGVFMFL